MNLNSDATTAKDRQEKRGSPPSPIAATSTSDSSKNGLTTDPEIRSRRDLWKQYLVSETYFESCKRAVDFIQQSIYNTQQEVIAHHQRMSCAPYNEKCHCCRMLKDRLDLYQIRLAEEKTRLDGVRKARQEYDLDLRSTPDSTTSLANSSKI